VLQRGVTQQRLSLCSLASDAISRICRVQNVLFLEQDDFSTLLGVRGERMLGRPGDEGACAPATPVGNSAFSAAVPGPASTPGPAQTDLKQQRDAAQYLVIRFLDIAIALVALAFLAPLLLLVSLSVFVADPGPVLFRHRRIGKHGVPFFCLKFRSMAIDAEERLRDLLLRDPEARAEWERDHKLRNDPRIVGIGRFLRKSSLDELPQLLNVLAGEMSLVGPRPIVVAEIERYGRYFENYCAMRPGITGLWQICGRNDVSYRRRVALDVRLHSTFSLKTYFKILIMTPISLLFSNDAY